jgi:PDZ domain-containing secreted protein
MSQEEFEALFAGTSPEYAIEAVNGATLTVADNDSSAKVYCYLKVTATENVTLTITTSSGGDTVIRVYDNASDAKDGSYNYIKSKDSGNDETLTYDFTAGTTYYIVTYYYYGSGTGNITTTVTVG